MFNIMICNMFLYCFRDRVHKKFSCGLQFITNCLCFWLCTLKLVAVVARQNWPYLLCCCTEVITLDPQLSVTVSSHSYKHTLIVELRWVWCWSVYKDVTEHTAFYYHVPHFVSR